MDFVLIEHFYFSNAFTGGNLLPRSDLYETKLTFQWSCDHQAIQYVRTFSVPAPGRYESIPYVSS